MVATQELPEYRNKNSQVLYDLASNLIGKKQDDRLSTVSELTNRLGVGRGTIQNAFRILQESGAISIISRGHLGAYLSHIDYKKLYDIIGLKMIVGSMPIPYSLRYEGLATGIYTVFKHNPDVGFQLAFMSGSDRRMTSLLEKRFDFIVMSLLSAKDYKESKEPIEILFEHSPKTYVNDHYLVIRNDFPYDGRPVRIGLDEQSHDQLNIVNKILAGKPMELVPLPYLHILENITNGNIDGTVWSMGDSINDGRFTLTPLPVDNNNEDNTKAAIVIRKGDTKTCNYLRKIYNLNLVESIQAKVLNKKIIPAY